MISIIAGFLYTRMYVSIVLRFGVIEPGVIDEKVSLLTSLFIFIVVIIVGGVVLLRKLSRKEIFVSASVVTVYGIIITLVQFISGSTSGPAAVWFMYLSQPFEWTGFFPTAYLYLQNNFGISLPFIGWIRFFAPLLFVLFGKSNK